MEFRGGRLRGDLIEVFKFVKGFVNIDRKVFSRRHSVIVGGIQKSMLRLDVRKFSFSQRVVNHWNALKKHAFGCNTVNSFKLCVDHHINDRGFS